MNGWIFDRLKNRKLQHNIKLNELDYKARDRKYCNFSKI